MGLVIYNTLTRKKEPFEPVTPGKIGIYLCGPTVYKPSHIGHAVGPIIFDAIKRYLVHCGYDVTWVVNITDVDDKLIDEATRQNTTTAELAERVTRDYLDAMATLHVDTIDIMPKASEHIGDIISIVERLMERGIAYESGGDVYFDVTKDPDYGKLSNRRIDEQESQRELQSGEKRNSGDFAVWKAAKPDEPDEVKFDSPWGKGRPGWHIECSAMSMRYLGETFDIHGGGLDLVFPHHENEIAQAECATGKPFAKTWMHNGLTRFNTKKVAKSDADPEMQAALIKMTLHNLLAAYPGELIRFFVLSTQYRRPIEYSEEEIEGKRKGLDAFYRLFDRIERICGTSPYEKASQLGEPRASARADMQTPTEPRAFARADIQDQTLATACDEYIARFKQVMDDDFNTAGAIASLFDFATTINRFIEQEKLETAVGTAHPTTAGAEPRASARADITEPRASARAEVDPQSATEDALTAAGWLIATARLIGLFIDPPEKKTSAEDALGEKAMQVLIKVRQHLREKKDFESADMIRDLLAEQKITLEDRPGGTIWRQE
ncbi:MAG: cysteine--tRNA ligase [Phycisphaerae bacterium]